MDWLLLGGLGIIWAAFLIPSKTRRGSPSHSVEGFVRDMEILAQTEKQPGRYVLMPERGERFLGPRERAHLRAMDRRRHVFTILLESVGLTALIGLFPPLRLMWVATAILAASLVAFVAFLLKEKAERAPVRATTHAPVRLATVQPEARVEDDGVRVLQPAANGSTNGSANGSSNGRSKLPARPARQSAAI